LLFTTSLLLYISSSIFSRNHKRAFFFEEPQEELLLEESQEELLLEESQEELLLEESQEELLLEESQEELDDDGQLLGQALHPATTVTVTVEGVVSASIGVTVIV